MSVEVKSVLAAINGLAGLLAETQAPYLTPKQEIEYRNLTSGDTQRILSASERMRALQKDESDGD